MKPIPDAPEASLVFDLAPERLSRALQVVLGQPDDAYLHWDRLRHLKPPADLSHEEWWLALKFSRMGRRMHFPLLTAKNGTGLVVSRHARLDAGFARLDRLLAGQVVLPEAARNESTRDRFIASSLMEEAIHSSLFEGAVSTREDAKDLLRSQREPASRDERMILNNYRAMLRIREMARAPLSLEGILELHRILTEGTLDRPEMAGRLQTTDDPRVDIVDHRLNRIVFSPPPAASLPERMQRLVDFANGEDIDGHQYVHPVLRSILLHFQLAYDHPFHDGNGRTARALFYWSMLRRGYWLAEFFSISRPIYRQRRPYELAFLQVESDAQDGTYFVLQQLDVLQQAVEELFDYVQRKSQAQNRLRRRLRDQDDLNHRQLALLEHALRNPDFAYSHESHAQSHRVSLMTARTDLLQLVERGWLRKRRSGKRMLYLPVEDLSRRIESAGSAHRG